MVSRVLVMLAAFALALGIPELPGGLILDRDECDVIKQPAVDVAQREHQNIER